MITKSSSEKHSLWSSWPLCLAVAVAVAVIGVANPAQAQAPPTGYVSVFVDHVPNRDATELRARAFAEGTLEAGPRLRMTASGFVEGLLADRRGRVRDAIAEPQELQVAFLAKRFDLSAGLSRVVWGRLDEIQPTDVINPIDVSRFFFEGRSEARMPVPLVRARVFAGDKVSVEGVYVPIFRKGRFDRLDERTSPFNLDPGVASCLAVGCPAPAFVPNEPARTAASAQGGARVNVTSGRVDWSVSAYRGFRPFGIYTLSPPRPETGDSGLSIEFPRFTMVGADFETVAGPWVMRGEVAAFVRDAFQAPATPAALTGRSFDAGAAVDRKAGHYRVSGQVLVHHETANRSLTAPSRTDVSLIVSGDRTFSRQKYQARLFGVYNPNSDAGFVRGIATASVRDNLALEGSLGWFAGSGLDTISRFADSDFAYMRLKYFF
jgi:hypothetical protein